MQEPMIVHDVSIVRYIADIVVCSGAPWTASVPVRSKAETVFTSTYF